MKSRPDVIDGLRRCADQSFCSGCAYYAGLNCTVELMTDAAELLRVDQGVIDQYRWERDAACDQLKEIDKGLGEKMDDIVKLIEKHKKAEVVYRQYDGSIESECGNCGCHLDKGYGRCPQCGKELDWDG